MSRESKLFGISMILVALGGAIFNVATIEDISLTQFAALIIIMFSGVFFGKGIEEGKKNAQ